MVVLGIGMRGEFAMLLVLFYGGKSGITDVEEDSDDPLAAYRLQHVHWIILASLVVSLVSYFGFGGWLQWYYYIKRRHEPETWKCQPNRFLTPENERHEILMGGTNMIIGAILSGVVATWIINGGYCTLYFNIGEKGWLYLVESTVLLFLIQDGTAYYLHRLNHIPWIYKRIHKHHHRYHSPTCFSATAMHPLEFIEFELALALPAFFLPCYSGSFIFLMIYSYYYGMIDHSGIKMDAYPPWQPESMFHDNHHRFFHCNFGFNMKLWDWMHDTLDRRDRIYAEDIFGGQGRPKTSSRAG